MKKLFTPLLLFLTVLLGGINASAEDEVKELTVDMFCNWTGFDASAVKGDVANGQEFNVGTGKELDGGEVVCGNGSVANTIFADLTGSTKLIIEGTAGMRLSISMNRQFDNSLVQPKVTIDENGILEMDLAEYEYVHINTIKVDWGSPSGTVNSIRYVMPADPLAHSKTLLRNQISTAKMYNAIAYTEESYDALQTAISEGEAALTATNTSETSLGTAKTNIENAISDLNLAAEYYYLNEKAQFKHYDSLEEPGEGANAGCAYDLFESVNTPYGDGNVSRFNWADVSEYDKLIVTIYGTNMPRVMMNRQYDPDAQNGDGKEGSSKEDSKMLEMQPNIDKWSTKDYTSYDDKMNVFSINLKKIVDDYTFAHLNAIKFNFGVNGILTGIYLYKAADPREPYRKSLGSEIEKAKMYNSIAYTEGTFGALQTAIKNGETEKENNSATVESLQEATSAITDAIVALKLAEGYSYLTEDMYKTYKSYDEPVEADTQFTGAYKLFETTDNPYGTGGSDNNRWADLAEYDKLIVTFVGGDNPRVWFNRKVTDGKDEGDSPANSNMLDLRAGNNKWSTKEYTSFEEKENNLKVFTVDLPKIKEDYKKITEDGKGVVRLHGIKYEWGAKGIVTGMYLYKSTNILEIPKEALEKEIAKAENCDPYLKSTETWGKLQDAINAGKEALNTATTVKALEDATTAIAKAIDGLKLQEGYSELTKDMYKKYNSVDNPGEGETATGDFKLFETTGQPFGVSTVDYDKWVELTGYDKLIVKTDGKGGKPRFLMNRLSENGQQGADLESSNMLDITYGADTWSAKAYADCKDDAYSIDLTKIIDDKGFARLNTIKSTGGDIYVTGMYLYKNPKTPETLDLTFDIDDPNHIEITVDGTKATLPENKILTVRNRAKLVISPANKFQVNSMSANDANITIPENKAFNYTKTIVKPYAFVIRTGNADPLADQKSELNKLIERAKLYDSFAMTEESFSNLTKAIETAETTLNNATAESLKTANDGLTVAMNVTLKEGYSELTKKMYKDYTKPGEVIETEGNYTLFSTSASIYGGDREQLKYADLSDYDQLILTTINRKNQYGNVTYPRFVMNRLEANGEPASTKEDSKLIEINPRDNNYNWWIEYQTVDMETNPDKYIYIIDLKKIVNDFGFARLHSIQINDWGEGVFVTGMYLYKAPYVAVTGVTLDNTPEEMVVGGKPLQLTATIAPSDATEKTVTWTSSNEKVATVDATGKVTAVGVGKVTITATAADENTATCAIKCYPQQGDADWDGNIHVNDAIHISNYVVQNYVVPDGWNETDYKEFYRKGANINGDANVTFADASAAVNLALAQQPKSMPEQNRIRASYDASADALVIGGASGNFGMFSIPVSLDNSMAYVALQADIILPEGASVEVKAGSRVADSHTMLSRKFADNHIRVAIFNLGNVTFADNDAPMFEIVTDSNIQRDDIVINNIYASDANANEYVLESRIGDTSGVAAIGFDANAPVKVFDLNGFYVSDTMEGLRQGTYIVRQGDNVKKVRIR